MSDTMLSADAAPRADAGWTSDDPYLRGAFAPVADEIDVSGLRVVEGRIPAGLGGTYMRNGPNPMFRPLAYRFPMDGDGMIHAVRFEDGRARYRNRFVATRGLAAERRAGRAIYGSLLRPVPVDPALVGADGEPGPVKNGAFINVVRHAGSLLALGEASPAYEITADLETVGEWQAGTGRALRFGGHVRRHPQTGSLWSLAYSPTAPAVALHEIDREGRWKRSLPVTLPAPSMIHDFVLTQRFVVLVIGPVVFDAAGARTGKPFLQWRPEMATRIAVVPLDGGDLAWIEAPACFVFHFANGFERGGEIVIDYVRHAAFRIGHGGPDELPPRLHRMVLDPARRTVREDCLAALPCELPRIDDRREAGPSRFVHMAALTPTFGADAASGVYNAIVRVDAGTGAVQCHDFGRRIVGEPAFVPRARAGGEDEGWLVFFAWNPADDASDLVLLDAAHVDDAPAAVVRMPRRVPQGLHGNWMARR